MDFWSKKPQASAAATASATLLDAEAISRAELLGLQARFIVEGFMAGEHKSPFRGFAIEFNQHREYVPGDDTRHLDWKVLGRTDRLFIKQYEQETNFVAHILLDASASMGYGSGSVTKLEYGKSLAACLAYLILLQRDALSVSIFDQSLREHLPRTGNLASIHALLHVLTRTQPGQTTSIAQTVHRLAGGLRRRGIVILISDLFDDDQAVLDSVHRLRFDGHEVIVFHVLDPAELNFPFEGLVEFEDLETSGKLLTRPREIRESYLREFDGFRHRMRDALGRQDCHCHLVDTSVPLVEQLSAYLSHRQAHAR